MEKHPKSIDMKAHPSKHSHERGESISMNERVHKKRGSRSRTAGKRGRSKIGINHSDVAPSATNTPRSILRKHNQNADPKVSVSIEPAALTESSSSSSDAAVKKVKWDPAVKESNRFSFNRLNNAVMKNLAGFAIGLDDNVRKVREKMQCGNMAYCAGDGGKMVCGVNRGAFEMNDILFDEDSENVHDNSGRETNSDADFVEMSEDAGMVTLVYNDSYSINHRRAAPVTSPATNKAKRKVKSGKETMAFQNKMALKEGKRKQDKRHCTTRQPQERKKGLKGALMKPLGLIETGMKRHTKKMISM